MEVTCQTFRDKSLVQVTIGYDHPNGEYHALFCLSSPDGVQATYRIIELHEYQIYDNFGCMYISHCTFVETDGGVYLALDPLHENSPNEDEDNFWFKGKSIEIVAKEL